MIVTNTKFLHWCLNCSPGKTGRNTLDKLKQKFLNRTTMTGDQINYNCMCYNKVDTIPDMVTPKDNRGVVSL